MKRCPRCGRSYDEDINFCLEDGTLLSSGLQDTIPQQTQMTVISGLKTADLPANSSRLKIPLIIGALVAVFLLLFGGALALIFYSAFPKSGTGNTANKDQQLSGLQRPSNTRRLSNDQPSNDNVFNNQDQEDQHSSQDQEDQHSSQQEGKTLSSNEGKNLNTNGVDDSRRNDNLGRNDDNDDLERDEETATIVPKDSESKSSEAKKNEGDDKKADLLSGRYTGSAINTTLGQTFGLSITISRNAAGGISGRVDVAKPFLGSGNITSGYADGKIISFVSYDRKNDITVYWEGEVKGNSMEGTYTATTSNPLVYPNTQYGVWRVKKAKER